MRSLSYRQILLLSMPAILQIFLKICIGTVDKIMVGYLGEAAVAGVGVTNQIIYFLLMFFATVGTGLGIMSSQFVGRKEYNKIKDIFGTSFIMGGIFGTILAIVFLFFSENLLELLSAKGDILLYGNMYFVVIAPSIIAIIISEIIVSIFRAYGDHKIPMYSSLIAGILNVILNFIFVYIFKFGIKGIALATVISRVIETFILLIILFKNDFKYKIRLGDLLKFSKDMFLKIVKVGWPITVDMISWRIASLVLISIIIGQGKVIAGVAEILVTVKMWMINPAVGIGRIISTYSGQYIARGKYKATVLLTNKSMKLALVILIFNFFLILILNTYIPNMFKFSPERKKMLGNVIVLFSLTTFSGVFTCIIPLVLRAGGDTKIIVLITTVSHLIISVSLTYYLCNILNWGIYGVIIGLGSGEFCAGFLFYLRFLQGKWKKMLV